MSGFGKFGKPTTQAAKPQQTQKSSGGMNLDLDDPSLFDYSSSSQGLPWIDCMYVLQLIEFAFYEGYEFKGPRASVRVLQVSNPEASRVVQETGKTVKAAQVGEELTIWFDVNAGKINGFDRGADARQKLSQLVAAFSGLSPEEAQAAMKAGEYSTNEALNAFLGMTPDETQAAQLVCACAVTTGKTRKGKFKVNVEYAPASGDEQEAAE